MKHIILFAALAFFTMGTASAQTTKAKAKAKTSKVKAAKKTTVKTKINNKTDEKNTFEVPPISNRKIVNWEDGQRATITGHEASAIGGGYSSLKKSATTNKASGNTSAKKNNKNKAKVPPISNRKIINWEDGQKATITGHEASPVGGGYQSLKKDTTSKSRVKNDK